MSASLEEILHGVRKRREERAHEKRRDEAAVAIQALIRGWLTRRRVTRRLLTEFDDFFPAVGDDGTSEVRIELRGCFQVYSVASRFLARLKDDDAHHRERLERLCRYLVASLESDSPKTSYIGVALNKEHSLSWIKHVKLLLHKCCVCMEMLKPEKHSESISLALYLHTLVAFTCPNNWAILRNKALAGLKPGMQQLCSNILGGLIQKGFFISLRVSINNTL